MFIPQLHRNAQKRKNIMPNGGISLLPTLYCQGLHGVDTNIIYGGEEEGATFKGNHGISFADTDEYTRIATIQGFAIEFWVKTSSTALNQQISIADNGGGSYAWNIKSESNILSFRIYDGTFAPAVLWGGVADGQWHHVVCVRQRSDATLKLYVDGALVDSQPDTTVSWINSNNKGFVIGSAFAGANEFIGQLKHFRIYGNQLSASDVTHLYNGGKGRTYMETVYSYMCPPMVSYPFNSNSRNEALSVMRHEAGANWLNNTINGSVTDAGYSWSTTNGGIKAVNFDENVHHGDVASVKLHLKGAGSYIEVRNGATSYYQASGQALKPSTSYKLSYWMKTHYVSGDSDHGAFVAYLMSNAGGASSGGDVSNTPVKITQDWTFYEMTFTTSATGVWGHPELRLYGQTGAGTLVMYAWFADFKLEELSV